MEKKVADYIIMIVFYTIFSPFVLLYLISLGVNMVIKYLFDKALNPLYNRLCKIIRGPIPNSTVHVKSKEDRYFKRINDKLLTKKEAKALGKEYEDKGYEVKLCLSEF